jgi:hydrogenase maturation protease
VSAETRPAAAPGAPPKVLVAGVGNIFMTDDAFGVEVVQRLLRTEMPAGVLVKDFGIGGIHLAYELLNGYDALVLVDAVPRNEPPGTLFVIEVDELADAGVAMDAHDLDPLKVLILLDELDGHIDRVMVVGCQPASIDDGMGLTDPVAAVVDDAVRLVREVVDDVIGDRRSTSPPVGESRSKGLEPVTGGAT